MSPAELTTPQEKAGLRTEETKDWDNFRAKKQGQIREQKLRKEKEKNQHLEKRKGYEVTTNSGGISPSHSPSLQEGRSSAPRSNAQIQKSRAQVNCEWGRDEGCRSRDRSGMWPKDYSSARGPHRETPELRDARCGNARSRFYLKETNAKEYRRDDNDNKGEAERECETYGRENGEEERSEVGCLFAQGQGARRPQSTHPAFIRIFLS